MIKKLLAITLMLAATNAHAETGNASWYSGSECSKINKQTDCPTASGLSIWTLERQHILFCASWNYPLHSKVRVTNVANGKSVVCDVLDRGPSKRLKRPIDLCLLAFRKIADPKVGIIKVKIERVSQ